MDLKARYDQIALHNASQTAMTALQSRQHYRNEWQPPVYQLAQTEDEIPKIPDQELFNSLEEAYGQQIPSIGQCAAHLELLQALYTIRTKVLSSEKIDKSFGIIPIPQIRIRGKGTRTTKVKIKDPTFVKRRQQKWPIYINLAVVRFEKWLSEMSRTLHQTVDDSKSFDLPHLPPLGMVLQIGRIITDLSRCSHGLAFIPAEPEILPRLLQKEKPCQYAYCSVPLVGYCMYLADYSRYTNNRLV
jgi:hypothetical protein